MKLILVTLNYTQCDTGMPASPAAIRELQVGCIRTNQPSLRKVIIAPAQVKHWKPPWPGPPWPLLALPLTGLV